MAREKLNITLDEELKKYLKIEAIEKSTSVSKLIEEAIESKKNQVLNIKEEIAKMILQQYGQKEREELKEFPENLQDEVIIELYRNKDLESKIISKDIISLENGAIEYVVIIQKGYSYNYISVHEFGEGVLQGHAAAARNIAFNLKDLERINKVILKK